MFKEEFIKGLGLGLGFTLAFVGTAWAISKLTKTSVEAKGSPSIRIG